jgi:hypothetical protein
MITTILILAACVTTGVAVFFWKRSSAFQYANDALRKSMKDQDVQRDEHITSLNNKIFELRNHLNQVQADRSAAKKDSPNQAEKPASSKRKYYRKPKGPKA